MARSRRRRDSRPRRRRRLRARPRAPGDGADPLADDLGPAVRAGLLLPQAQGEPADYTFTHEQVRQFAASQLSAARRRQVHAAVVDLLLDGGDPAPAGLPMLAQHALAAGDTRAGRALLDRRRDGRPRLERPRGGAPARRAGAPGRLDAGRPAGPPRDPRRRVRRPPPDRRAARRPDRAGRPRRGDARSGRRARRPAPARVGAADEPRRGRRRRAGPSRPRPRRRARRRARPSSGRRSSSARRSCGARSASRSAAVAIEVDLDGAEEAYRRAVELAEQLGDDRSLAAALREIGMIDFARGRAWFAGEVLAGRANEHARGGAQRVPTSRS